MTGKVADVDLGRVDGDYFANVASVGLTVAIAARPWGKRHLGRLAYVIAGLRAVASQRGFQVKLTIDGAPHRLVSSACDRQRSLSRRPPDRRRRNRG